MLAASTVFGTSLDELNSISKEALMETNGIGEAKATINERKKRRVQILEDLQRVEGIVGQTAADVKKVGKLQRKNHLRKKM